MISWIERRMQAWLATVREVHKIIFAWITVVSPTSRFANDSFTNVLGRFANVLSRFANVLLVNLPTPDIYPVLTKTKLLIDVWNAIMILWWFLGQEILSQFQFRLTDFRSICMFLTISQGGSSRGSWACWIPMKARQFPIRWYCITMWINIITFPFFRSKQSLFLQFDLVRNKMERTQVNNNSNFITIHSMKYLQAQKTYETYLQHLIETKLYLSETNLSYSQRCSSSHELVR